MWASLPPDPTSAEHTQNAAWGRHGSVTGGWRAPVVAFCFQRRLDDLSVNPGHLAADAGVAQLRVDVLSLEAQQLALAQAGGQIRIVQ